MRHSWNFNMSAIVFIKLLRRNHVMTQSKTLYRLPDQGLFGGVIAGIADYLDIDASIARLLFLFITLATGLVPGVIIYIVMLIILPKPAGESSIQPNKATEKASNKTSNLELHLTQYHAISLVAGSLFWAYGTCLQCFQLYQGPNCTPSHRFCLSFLACCYSKNKLKRGVLPLCLRTQA